MKKFLLGIVALVTVVSPLSLTKVASADTIPYQDIPPCTISVYPPYTIPVTFACDPYTNPVTGEHYNAVYIAYP